MNNNKSKSFFSKFLKRKSSNQENQNKNLFEQGQDLQKIKKDFFKDDADKNQQNDYDNSLYTQKDYNAISKEIYSKRKLEENFNFSELLLHEEQEVVDDYKIIDNTKQIDSFNNEMEKINNEKIVNLESFEIKKIDLENEKNLSNNEKQTISFLNQENDEDSWSQLEDNTVKTNTTSDFDDYTDDIKTLTQDFVFTHEISLTSEIEKMNNTENYDDLDFEIPIDENQNKEVSIKMEAPSTDESNDKNVESKKMQEELFNLENEISLLKQKLNEIQNKDKEEVVQPKTHSQSIKQLTSNSMNVEELEKTFKTQKIEKQETQAIDLNKTKNLTENLIKTVTINNNFQEETQKKKGFLSKLKNKWK